MTSAVDEPVDHGGSHDVVGEHAFAPPAERLVRKDQQRRPLIIRAKNRFRGLGFEGM